MMILLILGKGDMKKNPFGVPCFYVIVSGVSGRLLTTLSENGTRTLVVKFCGIQIFVGKKGYIPNLYTRCIYPGIPLNKGPILLLTHLQMSFLFPFIFWYDCCKIDFVFFLTCTKKSSLRGRWLGRQGQEEVISEEASGLGVGFSRDTFPQHFGSHLKSSRAWKTHYITVWFLTIAKTLFGGRTSETTIYFRRVY